MTNQPGQETGEALTLLREQLAEYAHDAWSGWMKYLFSKGQYRGELNADAVGGIDVVWIMPAWAVQRWKRQMITSYADLPESEKESDRAEADKMLGLMADTRALDAATIAQQAARIKELETELREARTRLSGAEAAYDDIEQLMFGEEATSE